MGKGSHGGDWRRITTYVDSNAFIASIPHMPSPNEKSNTKLSISTNYVKI